MITLGVDPGLKHLGLALADGPLARPLPSLPHISLTRSAAQLADLAQTHSAQVIVLGLPTGPIARLTHQLASQLAELTSCQVVLHDETLSTKEAIFKLRQGGAKRAKLQNEHSYAACLILEDYLETISSPK